MKLFKFISLVLACNLSIAQMPDLAFEHLTVKEGLPSNDTWCATKDKKGFIWIGSWRGISRYDGYNFRSVGGVNTGYCSGITTDKAGNIYASIANNGLCQIEAKTHNIKVLYKTNYNDKDLDNNHYEHVFIDSYNQAWMCDLQQVKRSDLNKNKLHKYPLSQSSLAHQIAHFFEDSGRNLWVVSDLGLYLYDRKNDKLVCILGKEASETNNKISLRLYSAFEDSEKNLWFGSHENGLIKYSFQDKKFSFFTEGIKNQNLTCGQESVDENGKKMLFIGTKNGLSVFYPDQKKFYNLPAFYQKGIHVRSFFDDKKNGFLWIMTREGIFKYQYRNLGIRTINIPPKIVQLPVGIMTFLQTSDDDYLLGLSHTGILKWKESANSYALIKYPTNAYTYKLRSLQNQVFAFTDKGVFQLKNNAFQQIMVVSKAFVSTEFVDGLIDKKGRFWVENITEGIKVFDLQTQQEIKIWNEKTHQKVFKNNYLKAIDQDSNGKIWIASCPNALYYFDDKNSDFVSVKDLPQNKKKTFGGLCNNSLNIDKDNTILLASWGGINKIANDGEILTTFEYEKDKLADSYCGNICDDSKGNLWFNTNEGIHIAKPTDRSIKRLTSVEGLFSNTSFGFLKNNQNQLFLGYNNTFNILNINELSSSKFVPKIEISSVEIHGTSIQQDFSKEIIIEPTKNAITLSFTTLNYEPTSKNIYQYQLIGFDKDWVNLGVKNTISFTNLEPKSYVLKVKSGNTIGVWNDKPLIINLLVKPYFHETIWFKTFVGILSVSLLFGFLRWRVNTIHEKNTLTLQMSELKLKALQSQMNPHFLFNSLNSVQNYILTNRGIEGAKYLSKFSKLVRKILENSNHQYLRFEQIIETLKMYVEIESFRFNNEFYFEFCIEENEVLLDSLMPPMLLQPYVENAIWHGLMPKEGDKKLVITAFIKDNHICCQIEDNGIGRIKNNVKEGHISRGQEMTKGIFDLLKNKDSEAKLEIIDLFDFENKPIGTRVEMVIPIEK